MANEILGQLSYATFYDEVTWGTKPGTPDYIYIPVNTYGVKFKANSRQSTPYLGIFQRKHNKRRNGMCQGGIELPAFSYWIDTTGDLTEDMSVAEYILSWAFDNINNTYLPSKGIEWAEGPDVANVNHAGLRVNTCTLSGSADSGGIIIALDTMGGAETPVVTAQAVPDDMNNLVDFDFAEVVLTLDSTPIDIDSFTLSLNNGLKPKMQNATTPNLMPRGTHAVDLAFGLVKNSDTYHVANRLLTSDTEYDIQLSLTGSHNATGSGGTDTTILIDMPRCSLIDPDDQRNREDFTITNVQTMVLKPDSSEDSINFTYGTA